MNSIIKNHIVLQYLSIIRNRLSIMLDGAIHGLLDAVDCDSELRLFFKNYGSANFPLCIFSSEDGNGICLSFVPSFLSPLRDLERFPERCFAQLDGSGTPTYVHEVDVTNELVIRMECCYTDQYFIAIFAELIQKNNNSENELWDYYIEFYYPDDPYGSDVANIILNEWDQWCRTFVLPD